MIAWPPAPWRSALAVGEMGEVGDDAVDLQAIQAQGRLLDAGALSLDPDALLADDHDLGQCGVRQEARQRLDGHADIGE